MLLLFHDVVCSVVLAVNASSRELVMCSGSGS